MEYSKKILRKLDKLTNIKDKELLFDAFSVFMFDQFSNIEIIALYKYERIQSEVSLILDTFKNNSNVEESLDVFHDRVFASVFDAIINNKVEHDVCYIEDHNLHIISANTDKQAQYFLVYQLLELEFEHHKNDQLNLIYHISNIYSNHQTMISLNEKDALTGLFNRKSFDKQILGFFEIKENNSRRRNKDSEASNCLAILDIDHFKNINDSFGHLYGDEVLLHFAQQMQKVFRDDDLLFRYGGEEFVVLLRDVNLENAMSVLHRFRIHVENYHFPQIKNVTVSIGVTLLDETKLHTEIMDKADSALYYIKENGRNNVGCYESLINDGSVKDIHLEETEIEIF